MNEVADVCVLLPTMNEAASVADVIRGFQDEGYDNILVIDGGSSDGTVELAEDAGARVVTQSGSGKGQAVTEAVEDHIEADYIIMADADATYRPEEADDLVAPLFVGADHVIGNRFANMTSGAMSGLNKFGNGLINRSFAYIHGHNLSDILSGYRAFTRESFLEINPTTTGFGIETELSVEGVRHAQDIRVVPIHYDPRPSGSATNLRPIRDGGLIFLTLYRLARTNNPLFYFGSVGVFSALVGLLIGAFVGYRWFMHSVAHDVLAVVAAFGIIVGIQLLMFGLLSDLIVKLHREQLRHIENND